MDMTLLQGTLPESITVDGQAYPIYTDFRRWVRLESIMFEEEGDFLLKIPTFLKLCYQALPATLEQAISGMVDFYEGPVVRWRGRSVGQRRPVCSFVQDESLIYAAFYQQYGIDLTTARLHWWQFQALLQGISEQTQLAQVMHYRSADISRLQNPEEKRFYRRMKELYRLRDTRSDREREAMVSAALEGLF